MNEQIKEISEKYQIVEDSIQGMNIVTFGRISFEKLLIEICELQKIEDNKTFQRMIRERIILQSKNIAE